MYNVYVSISFSILSLNGAMQYILHRVHDGTIHCRLVDYNYGKHTSWSLTETNFELAEFIAFLH